MVGRFSFRFAALCSLAVMAACASAPPPMSAPVSHKVVASKPFDYGRPHVIEAQPPLQCVAFARNESGIQIYGDANRWWAKAAGRYPRGTTPHPGAVMVLKGYNTDKRGHVAVVRRMVSDRRLIIDHANWMGRGEISKGVPVEDVSPANDWSQVRVWNIAGTRWGSRTNTVEGFIYRDQAIASR